MEPDTPQIAYMPLTISRMCFWYNGLEFILQIRFYEKYIPHPKNFSRTGYLLLNTPFF